MTIESTTRSVRTQGNDATTVFDYDFLIPTGALTVVLYDTGASTYTELDASEYSVTGLDDVNGGTVTYPLTGTPITPSQYLIIRRDVPYTQPLDIANQGGFFADTVMEQLDRTAMMAQQLAEVQARSLITIEGEEFARPMPIKSALAGNTLAFDANGEPTTGPSVGEVSAAGTYAQQTIDALAGAEDARDEAADYAALARNNWVIKRFAGDGNTTDFELSVDPGSEDNVFVFVDGVMQAKGTYSVSGTTLTLTEAPPGDGVTLNIEVRFGSSITVSVGTPTDATVTPAKFASSIYASQAEAEAGVENTKLMTALRTNQAIAAQAAVQTTGTWTPAITFGGGSTGVTYNANNKGTYVKIGKLVLVTFQLELAAKGSSTGIALMTGLPFASANNGIMTGGSVGLAGLFSAVTGSIGVAVDNNSTNVRLYQARDGASTALLDTNFTDTSYIYGSVTYEAAS